MQANGTFGKLDSLATKRRNVVITDRRTSVEIFGSAQAKANIGFYQDA